MTATVSTTVQSSVSALSWTTDHSDPRILTTEAAYWFFIRIHFLDFGYIPSGLEL